MTHVIIAVDGNTYIHKEVSKTADELCREIELGSFECPVSMKNPTAVRLQNYLLVAEREENPLLDSHQRSTLEMLSQGATVTQIARSLYCSPSGVRHRLDSLKKKFNVNTNAELIAVYSRCYK